MTPQDLGKKAAGDQAVLDLVRPGMKLGLGTGSTAFWAIKKTGELFRAGALPGLLVVPTSFDTEILCQEEDLAVRTLGDKAIDGRLDLYLDGADEVDPDLNCIKGGGGAQLQEKIVCSASRTFVIIADESKAVPHLGDEIPGSPRGSRPGPGAGDPGLRSPGSQGRPAVRKGKGRSCGDRQRPPHPRPHLRRARRLRRHGTHPETDHGGLRGGAVRGAGVGGVLGPARRRLPGSSFPPDTR